MENIIKNLLQIGENFAVTTAAMGTLPTPVVGSTKIKVETKVKKDTEKEEEKELT